MDEKELDHNCPTPNSYDVSLWEGRLRIVVGCSICHKSFVAEVLYDEMQEMEQNPDEGE